MEVAMKKLLLAITLIFYTSTALSATAELSSHNFDDISKSILVRTQTTAHSINYNDLRTGIKAALDTGSKNQQDILTKMKDIEFFKNTNNSISSLVAFLINQLSSGTLCIAKGVCTDAHKVESFEACSCIGELDRVFAATLAVLQISYTFKKDPFNYVGFAAGRLLQDFVIINALKKLDMKINNVSFIDIVYNQPTVKGLKQILTTKYSIDLAPEFFDAHEKHTFDERLPVVITLFDPPAPGPNDPIASIFKELKATAPKKSISILVEKNRNLRGAKIDVINFQLIVNKSHELVIHYPCGHHCKFDSSADTFSLPPRMQQKTLKQYLKHPSGALIFQLQKGSNKVEQRAILDFLNDTIISDEVKLLARELNKYERETLEKKEPVPTTPKPMPDLVPINTASKPTSSPEPVLTPLTLADLEELSELIQGEEATLEDILDSLSERHHKEQFQLFHEKKTKE
jgi:hypothetical protein